MVTVINTKMYDNCNISTIEGDIEAHSRQTKISKYKMIQILHYLETTERFKENPSYKNSTFDVYIKDRFCITPTTYQNLRMAYHNFEAESVRFGPGFIVSVKKKCGAEKIGTVLKEINQIAAKTKKPISRKKMQAVVDKHTKKRKVPNTTPPVDTTDWKLKYEAELSLRVEAEKELALAREQIERLKDTVLKLRAAQVAIQQAAESIRKGRVSVS